MHWPIDLPQPLDFVDEAGLRVKARCTLVLSTAPHPPVPAWSWLLGATLQAKRPTRHWRGLLRLSSLGAWWILGFRLRTWSFILTQHTYPYIEIQLSNCFGFLSTLWPYRNPWFTKKETRSQGETKWTLMWEDVAELMLAARVPDSPTNVKWACVRALFNSLKWGDL